MRPSVAEIDPRAVATVDRETRGKVVADRGGHACLVGVGAGQPQLREAGRGRMLDAASASDCPERSSQVSSAQAA